MTDTAIRPASASTDGGPVAARPPHNSQLTPTMAHIVFIDDDEFMHPALQRMLEELGHQVRAASNGRVGLRLVHEAEPDIVITDVFMPDKDGFEVIHELRCNHPAVRVIAVTGGARFGSDELLTMARQLGAWSGLAKPFTPETMARAVDAAYLCQRE